MKVEDHQREGESAHETLQRILALYAAVQEAWRGFWTRGGASPKIARERGEGSLAWLQDRLTAAFADHDGFVTEATPNATRPCVFCGESLDPRERHNMQVQVEFGGWKPHGKGQVMMKNPGKVIYWHGVCGVPEEDSDG